MVQSYSADDRHGGDVIEISCRDMIQPVYRTDHAAISDEVLIKRGAVRRAGGKRKHLDV
jgi:hypothetical protein